MNEALLLLVVGGVLAASLIIALGASKVGVPSLVAFLVLGMLLGSDGIGQVEFTDVHLARTIGIAALALIIFEGGLSTSWRRLRTIAISAALLSTIGVVVTAILTGFTAYFLLHLSYLESFLLGAVVSSTDAAAVFATLRYTKIKKSIARTLEAETGGNDPMAIALTMGLIAWVLDPAYDVHNLLLLLVQQLGIGLVLGLALGWAATWVFSRMPRSLDAFAPVASVAACALAYGTTAIIGGSGFLAVYLVGLAIGSTPSQYRRQLVTFHEGLAFLSQVVLFVSLGLLVFPHQLLSVAATSVVIALLLMFVIRPIAVWVSLPFSSFNSRERLLLGFAGLRGAVPIVLGTFVLSSNVPHREIIFNTVFFVVLVSALIQGSNLERIARWLGAVEDPTMYEPEVARHEADNKHIMIEFIVKPHHSISGVTLKEVGLPRNASVASITRGKKSFNPHANSVLQPEDHLMVVATARLKPAVEDVIERWQRRV